MLGRSALPILEGPKGKTEMQTISYDPGDAVLVDALRAEHRALEARVRELDSHPWLSAEEQLEMAALKKLKLAKKDQLAEIERRNHEES